MVEAQSEMKGHSNKWRGMNRGGIVREGVCTIRNEEAQSEMGRQGKKRMGKSEMKGTVRNSGARFRDGGTR